MMNKKFKENPERIRSHNTNKEKGNNQIISKRDQMCRKIIDYGILGVIVFSPLPAASVYYWSVLVIELIVLVMLGAYVFMEKKPQNNELMRDSLKWPRYLFWGFLGLVLFQIIPWPHFLVKIFSPSTSSFRELFGVGGSGGSFMSISLIPSLTLKQGLEILSYFILGFLIINTVTRMKQVRRIVYVLVGMGIFQAFYGLFELYNPNPRILFYEKVHALDCVTGTFVNRNHFSGYLEMVIPLAIGLVIARVDFLSMSGLKWREKILRLSEKGTAVNLILGGGVVVMAVGVVYSKSRSGVFLLVLTFLLFFELTVFYFGRARHQQKGVKNFLKVSFLIITLIVLYVGVGSVVERFTRMKLMEEGRFTYWENTMEMVGNYPVFGTGLGTFGAVYPAYEESSRDIWVSHAHNDYLEYLSEVGFLGIVLLLGGILFMGVHSFLIWQYRRHPEVKGYALGGIVALVAILIHSITDFNLHIPANMVLFTVVLSLTLVTAFYKRNSKNSGSSG